MTFFKLLSVVCGFLLFASAFGAEYTKVKIGCYNFTGTVRCRYHRPILKSAVVELWESDVWRDDLEQTEHLQPAMDQRSATFSWHGCYDDGIINLPLVIVPGFKEYPTMDLYYVFKDVCDLGDSYTAKDVLQNKTAYVLQLYDDEYYGYAYLE